MMDSTLAQIFNHVVELEIDNMQLKEALKNLQEQINQEPAPQE